MTIRNNEAKLWSDTHCCRQDYSCQTYLNCLSQVRSLGCYSCEVGAGAWPVGYHLVETFFDVEPLEANGKVPLFIRSLHVDMLSGRRLW